MMQNIKLIVDTSIFINPSAYSYLGSSPFEALNNFISNLKNKENFTCYIPPSVYNELIKFLEKEPSPDDLAILIRKPPSSYQTAIPSLLFYEFIQEMRARINKGLRIAEKYTRKGLGEQDEEELIKRLREEYRLALREGIIDSKEDFDLILLAKELDGYLATADQGMVKWAEKLGITCLDVQGLVSLLKREDGSTIPTLEDKSD